MQNKTKSKTVKWIIEVVLITALSFFVYGNAIHNNYNIDDAYIVPLDSQNEVIKEGPDAAIPILLNSRYNEAEGATYGYRPMGKITMAYEYKFWGNNPRNSHIVNIALFAINVILLLVFTRQLKLIGIKVPEVAIYFAMALFIFHPIHTEVVCSIKNREEILCFIFMLLALIAFIQFLKKDKILLFIPFGAFAILSMLSKQTAFNLFGWLLLLVFVGARFSDIKLNKLLKIVKYGVFVFATFLLYYIVFIHMPSTLTPADIEYSFEQNPYKAYPGSLSIPNGIQTLFFYIKKLFIPFPLLFYYGYDMLPLKNWSNLSTYLGIVLMLLATFYVLRTYFKKLQFEIPFWIVVFAISIFPFSNLLKPIYITGIVGERLVYQASFAFCMLIALVVLNANSFLSKKIEFQTKTWHNYILLLPILSVFYVITSQRSLQWEDKQTLYEHDIKYLSKSARANSMIASMYMKSLEEIEGKKQLSSVKKAKRHFEQSVYVYPNYGESWLKLALIHSKYFNNIDSALICLDMIENDSSNIYIQSLELRGDLFGRTKIDNIKALKNYREFWQFDNSKNRVYQKIQNILFQEELFNEAIRYADEAINKNWVEGFVDKGDALLALGNIADAIYNYNLAIENGFKPPEFLKKVASLQEDH